MEAPTGTPEEWTAIVCTFIKDHVQRAGASGVVVGLSGGLDSAVAVQLAARALGHEAVFGITMPAHDSNPLDAEHARLSADAAGVAMVERNIGDIADAAARAAEAHPGPVVANLKARSRMMVLYAEAQKRGWLVLGTGNKSELLTGYFSKHGDGGVDLQPIGDLYKTQVRELAEHLGVPRPIIDKPPSAGLRPGQTDEDDFGLSYENLDRILKGFELNASPEAIAARTGLALEKVHEVDRMVRRSEHKRRAPLVPKTGIRTVGIDWRRSVHWDA